MLRSPLRGPLRSPLDALGAALLPCPCKLCEQPLLRFESSPICDACWRSLVEQPLTDLCITCGEHLGWDNPRFSSEPPDPRCTPCRRLHPPFQQAIAWGVYQDTLREFIHLLKYDRIAPLAGPLGHLLAQSVARLRSLPESITVVAVPLYRAKEKERSFNQTVLLAGSALRALRRSHPQIQWTPALRALGRQRQTATQAGLNPRERRQNLRGAFNVVEPKKIAGSSILLIDDIYTTGATARECSRTLRAAGAAQILIATLARSQREGVVLWDPAPTFIPDAPRQGQHPASYSTAFV